MDILGNGSVAVWLRAVRTPASEPTIIIGPVLPWRSDAALRQIGSCGEGAADAFSRFLRTSRSIRRGGE